ncbi:hypothetical protein F4805DRAFT_421203 [Annulohypoxylon moriforme]|nr:hypothetical protein F4805DRAFT_421203 [Annulohypoxylon moriforme]
MDPALSLHHQAHAAYLRRIGPLSTDPTIRVESGAEITLDLPDLSRGQITRNNATDNGVTLTSIFGAGAEEEEEEEEEEGEGEEGENKEKRERWDRCGFGIGPIYVEGAEAGDVLKVEVLSVTPKEDYAWTALVPGFGAMWGSRDWLCEKEDPTPEEYQMVKIWDLKSAARDRYLVFKSENPQIQVPYEPCLGIIGLAPGSHPTASPPLDGEDENAIEINYLKPGSSISFPVKVKGALLNIADAHATPSPGSACGTGVEMAAQARIKVTVEKNNTHPSLPPSITPTTTLTIAISTEPEPTEETHHMFLGVDPLLSEANEVAVSGIVHHVSEVRRLSHREAYMLFSAAGSLRRLDDPEGEEYEGYCEIESSVPFTIFGE